MRLFFGDMSSERSCSAVTVVDLQPTSRRHCAGSCGHTLRLPVTTSYRKRPNLLTKMEFVWHRLSIWIEHYQLCLCLLLLQAILSATICYHNPMGHRKPTAVGL